MKDTQTKKISVIIPCYNYAHYLRAALDSVLEQETPGAELEVIVVNDGSSDATEAIVTQEYDSVIYIYQENKGLSAARNTGAAQASGDFILFLDADDLLATGNLQSHLQHFSVCPELDVSVCLCLRLLDDQEEKDRNYLWPLKREQYDLHICYDSVSPMHSHLLRADTVRRFQGFDTSLRACEDMDFWLRCAADGRKFGVTTGGHVFYRHHADSMTKDKTQQWSHEAAMRYRVARLLEQAPLFPKAGKYYGWLAHAAGCMTVACRMMDKLPTEAVNLLRLSCTAIAHALSTLRTRSSSTPYLDLAEKYYAGEFLRHLKQLAACGLSLPEAVQAFFALRHKELLAMPLVELSELQTERLLKLCCHVESL